MPSTATSILDGLSTSVAVKSPCRTVATSNITLSGLQTIAGYTTVEDDRVLVKGQTDPIENGIYMASTGSWTRAKDADGNRDLVQGTRVLVRSTTVDGVEYELTTANPIVIGATALTFTLRYGANATYDQTEAEIAAGVTPTNYAHEPGEVLRQGNNTTPGTTNVITHIQAAIDAASDIHAEVYLRDDNAIGAPLLIRSTTTQNLSLIGNGRVSTILRPNAADIKAAAQNINTLIFNQANNGHLHIEKFRCLDAAVYTGKFMYALEGGGADASGQAAFSMVVEDSWFAFSSNNSGIFWGGFSNLMVRGCVFEGSKAGCFLLEGAGNGDQQYIGNVMNACYDPFISAITDALTKANITVDTLHVYQHLRGAVIEIKNGIELTFTNITVEPDTSNVGDVGILKLTDCQNVTASNLTMKSRSGVPVGACAIDIITTTGVTSTGIFSNITSDATIGVRTQGAGSIDLTFNNCDLSGCQHAWQHLSGNTGGTMRFVGGCKLNNSLKDGLLTSAGSPTFTVIIDSSCEIINAGMDSTTTARNVNLSTSGDVLIDARVGQNSGSAAATHYFRLEGSGRVRWPLSQKVGTPPTGVKTGAQALTCIFEVGYGGEIASASTITLPDYGDSFIVTGTTNIDTIETANQEGRTIKLIFASILTVTDASNLLMAGNFVTSGQDTLSLVCNGTSWYETGRSVN